MITIDTINANIKRILIDNKIDMIINCTPNTPLIHEIIDKKIKKQRKSLRRK